MDKKKVEVLFPAGKKQKANSVVITAIICLTLLEAYALSQGIDGVIFTTVVAVIAGVAGWTLPSPIKLQR